MYNDREMADILGSRGSTRLAAPRAAALSPAVEVEEELAAIDELLGEVSDKPAPAAPAAPAPAPAAPAPAAPAPAAPVPARPDLMQQAKDFANRTYNVPAWGIGLGVVGAVAAIYVARRK